MRRAARCAISPHGSMRTPRQRKSIPTATAVANATTRPMDILNDADAYRLSWQREDNRRHAADAIATAVGHRRLRQGAQRARSVLNGGACHPTKPDTIWTSAQQ